MGLRNSDSESIQDLTIVVGNESSVVRVYENGPQTGETLVVLHGWGSSSDLMAPLTRRLSAKWRTVAIDMPGHGSSPAPPSAWSVRDHAQIVSEVVRMLKIEAFALVGHSNGGRISIELASNQSIKLKPSFLILISPSGIPRNRTAAYYVRLWTAKVLKWPFYLFPGVIKEFGLDWLRNSLIWKFLGSSDYRALTGVMKDTFVRTVNHYVVDQLPSVKCPVVVFWGSNDDAITRRQMEILVLELPDAGLFVLENAGHFGYLDQPDPIVSTIQAMLDGGAK